jgi:soluble cytochrome b562
VENRGNFPFQEAWNFQAYENFTIGKERRITSYCSRMKKHIFLLAGGLFMMFTPAMAEEHTELANQMDTMDDAFKGFRRETDPVKGAAAAREAQTAALKSTLELPEMVKAMPDSPAKVKATLEYRKMMGKLFIVFCEAEEAFLAGKMEAVAAAVEAVKELKKAGHDQFIPEDE